MEFQPSFVRWVIEHFLTAYFLESYLEPLLEPFLEHFLKLFLESFLEPILEPFLESFLESFLKSSSWFSLLKTCCSRKHRGWTSSFFSPSCLQFSSQFFIILILALIYTHPGSHLHTS